MKAAIATINTKLPFLITLNGQERKELFKLGPKSADFVADASSAVASFPNILPTSFDKVEYGKDAALFKALADIKMQLDSLTEKVDNTTLAVGSEAIVASLEVFAYVQTAADRRPNLKSVAEKLKERFKGQGHKKATITKAN